jgi:IclR family transcriptional regulator, KDG regulon repressor
MKTIKSVSKALSILELFLEDNQDEMTLGQIAEESGVKKTTASHIVSTLMAHGFINQKTKRGKYSLGVRSLDFSRVVKRGPKKYSGTVSLLSDLSRLTNHIVYLATWYGSDILFNRAYYYSFELPQKIPGDWFTVPLAYHCMGKIVLAEMTEADLDKYFSVNPLVKLGPKSILDIKQIKAQLLDIKKEGIAYEEEEWHVNVNGVAAGIRDSENETIGAAYIMGNSTVLTGAELRKIAPTLHTCALKISRELVSNIDNVNEN